MKKEILYFAISLTLGLTYMACGTGTLCPERVERGSGYVPTGHRAVVTAIGFSRDSKKMLTASMDGTIRRWDLATRKMEKLLHQQPERANFRMLPGGELFAMVDKKHSKLVIKNAHTGEVKHVLNGYGWPIAFFSDGKKAVYHDDNGVLVVDIEQGLTTVVGRPSVCQNLMAGNNTMGNGLVFACERGDMFVLDEESLKIEHIEKKGPNSPTFSWDEIQVSSDGRTVVTAGARRILVIDVTTGRTISELRNELDGENDNGQRGCYTSVRYLEKARRVVASDGCNWPVSYVLLWDADTGELLEETVGYGIDSFFGLEISPNEKIIAVSSCGCAVQLLDAETLEIIDIIGDDCDLEQQPGFC